MTCIRMCVAVALVCLSRSGLFSQTIICSYPLQVAANKTTNLIFPYAVKSVDRGCVDIFAQKAPGVENIVQVKAAHADFPATTLSVITAQGKLYSFIVRFKTEPDVLNISFGNDDLRDSLKEMILFEHRQDNVAALDSSAKNVLLMPVFLNRSVSEDGMKLSLKSIYEDHGLLWFRFSVSNQSLISFHPGYIKFFTADQRRIKRTAEQEVELDPVLLQFAQVVPGRTVQELVVAFPSFTLPDHKRMICQLSESGGGRLLNLHIRHQTVLKARVLDSTIKE